MKFLSEVDLTLPDTTTDDVSTAAHGLCPKAPNDAKKFLRGDATWNTVERSCTITLETPTAAEDIAMFYTADAITISKIVTVVVGSSSPSVTVDIRHGTDMSAAGTALITTPSATTNTTGGAVVTTFNNASVAAGSWVRFKTTAMSGTVTKVVCTIVYS